MSRVDTYNCKYDDGCLSVRINTKSIEKNSYSIKTEKKSRFKIAAIWQGCVLHLGRMFVSLPNKKEIDSIFFQDLIIREYLNGDLDSFIANLDGYFSIVIIDESSATLITDRNGLSPIYWFKNNNLFKCSFKIGDILKNQFDSFDLNVQAICDFAKFGYMLGEQTIISGVKLLKPATIMKINYASGTIDSHNYWSWTLINPLNLSFDDAVDQMYVLLMDSVQKLFQPSANVGISLSGGLDSRFLLAAANKLYPDYRGILYTFGTKLSDDVKIAQQVASLTNWDHKIHDYNNQINLLDRIESVWDTGGMLSIQHLHGVETSKDLHEQIDFNLNGYMGDVIVGGGLLEGENKKFGNSFSHVESYYSRQDADPEFDLSYLGNKFTENAIYYNRTRRFTNLGTIANNQYITQLLPFHSNNVLTFSMQIPRKYKYNNNLYNTLLTRYFPKFFNEIPWQKTLLPVRQRKPTLIYNSHSKLKIIINNIQQRLQGSGGRNFVDYTDIEKNLSYRTLSNIIDQTLAEHDKSQYAANAIACINDSLQRLTIKLFLAQLLDSKIRK